MDVGDTPHQCNDMSNTWDFCRCDSDLGTELTNQAERMTEDCKTNESANNISRPCGMLEPLTQIRTVRIQIHCIPLLAGIRISPSS